MEYSLVNGVLAQEIGIIRKSRCPCPCLARHGHGSVPETSTQPIVLDGWTLLDRQNKRETISGLRMGPCESATLRLRGASVQLSNRGGVLRLLNAASELVHVVTYSQAQAVGGRELVF